MILTSPVVTISHGTTVALFNRIKSQTTSTRYLSVVPDFTRTLGSDGRPVTGAKTPQYADEKGALKGFTADASFWESFIIWLVDPSLPSGPSNHQPPNPDWPRPLQTSSLSTRSLILSAITRLSSFNHFERALSLLPLWFEGLRLIQMLWGWTDMSMKYLLCHPVNSPATWSHNYKKSHSRSTVPIP